MSIFISASLLEDYISCNKKVYFRLNKSEEQVQNKEMIIGEIVHSAIEKYWELWPAATGYVIGEVKNRLNGDRESERFALDCIKTYFLNFRQHLTYQDKIETRFKIPWDKDTYIVGKMDRISNGNIFDWKTSRTPPTNISNNVQFILYDWAYRHMFKVQATGVYYGALTSGSLIRYSENKLASTALLTELIPEVIGAIKNKTYTMNGIFRKACFRCSYSDACLKRGNINELDSTASS